jgi:hypothetical protein
MRRSRIGRDWVSRGELTRAIGMTTSCKDIRRA